MRSRSISLLVLLSLAPLTGLAGAQGTHKSTAAPPVPASFQDLYTTLNGDLDSFNASITSVWNGSKYPVLFAGTLTNANSNSGKQLVNPGYFTGVQMQLQGLKAVGAKAVMVQVSFPVLYQPFFSTQSEYQQYVSFYQQVATAVRALDMKLIVEDNPLLSTGAQAGWNVAPFFATLTWDQYQQARAQNAATVAQTMQPDYMVLVQEPQSEAAEAGQPNVGTVSGATSLVTQMLAGVRQTGVAVQLGAGVANWQPQYDQFIQSFVAQPLDFIDMHIYPVNTSYPAQAMTIASIAAAAGKPVSMSECWLWKTRDSELGAITTDQIQSRNTFSFWEPLDSYFLQTVVNFAYYTKMAFVAPVNTDAFWAYQDYNAIQNWTPAQILKEEATLTMQNTQAASYTPTAQSYYGAIVSPADTMAPSVPTSLAGVSGSPTQTSLTWNASTDNVGVAGYFVYRNGLNVATTAQASYQDTGLNGSTTYTYFLTAFDMAGNVSAPSPSIPVSTRDVVPPAQPPNVVATAVSPKQINLSWGIPHDDVGVGSFRVFQGPSAGALAQVATKTGTATTYSAYNLTPATTYYFGVQAVDTSGNISAMSTIVPATTLAPPSAPTGLTATPTTPNQIALQWSVAQSGLPVTGYHVFRGLSASALSQIASVAGTSYTDLKLTPSTAYYYAVQTLDTGGNLSPMSTVVKTTTLAGPSVPANLTAAPVSTKQIALTWSASSGGAAISSYRISRGSTSSNLSQIATVSGTSYTDNNLTPSTTYYYGVQAVDTGGNVSAQSATVSARTLPLPSPPANLTATSLSKVQASLIWSPAQSGMPLASYHVYRGSAPGSLGQIKVVKAPQTSATDYPLTADSTYYYAVQSADTQGNLSALSSTVVLTMPK